jgi:hypothetical protein
MPLQASKVRRDVMPEASKDLCGLTTRPDSGKAGRMPTAPDYERKPTSEKSGFKLLRSKLTTMNPSEQGLSRTKLRSKNRIFPAEQSYCLRMRAFSCNNELLSRSFFTNAPARPLGV